MNKVTVEITQEGWKTIVNLDGQEISEEHKRMKYGSSSVGDLFEDNDLINDELLSVIDDVNSAAYNVMKELNYYD